MKVSCAKPDAAVRQLDVAIGLLFTDGDPLAVRALAGASFTIWADLAEARELKSSWRTKLVKDSGLSEKEAVRVLNSAQNFLKHANKDPDALLTFDEEENDHLIFLATIECGGLGHRLSFTMQAYQVWYLALYPEKVGIDTDPVKTAKLIFPDIRSRDRSDQLSLGHQFLERVLARKGLI